MRAVLVAFLCVSFIATNISYAHSGGTDANGCHGGSQPYHCHGGSELSGGDTDAVTVTLIVVGGVVVVGGLIWLICWGASYNQQNPQPVSIINNDGLAALPTVDVLVGDDSGGLQLKWFW